MEFCLLMDGLETGWYEKKNENKTATVDIKIFKTAVSRETDAHTPLFLFL